MRRGRLCWQDQGRKYLKYKLNKKDKNQTKREKSNKNQTKRKTNKSGIENQE